MNDNRVRLSRTNVVAMLAVLGCIVTASVPAVRETLGALVGATRADRVDVGAALAAIAVALLVHAVGTRRTAAVRAAEADRAAQEARDLDRLVDSSVAIAGTLDSAQLRVEAWRHVPQVTGGRPAWIAVRTPQDWQWVVEPDAASAASWLDLAPRLWELAETGAGRYQHWRLFVLGSAARAQGLLAIDDTRPLDAADERRLAWLAAMLGTAISNVHYVERLQMHCVSDALTGCFNRAHAFASLESELRRARRTGRPLSLLMIDVDDFKRINDEHGHLCGDTVLEALGEVLRRTLRTSDVKCRYGGDEFLVILPETPAEGAEVVAEHLRRAVARVVCAGRKGPVTVRASIGTATAAPDEADALSLVARADAALYRVKARRSTPEAASGFLEAAPFPLDAVS